MIINILNLFIRDTEFVAKIRKILQIAELRVLKI